MAVVTQKISSDAKSMLDTLKDNPGYLKHYYDEHGQCVLVYMQRWFGQGKNAYGLNSFEIESRIGGVVIPYRFERMKAVQS